jgi:hypothetical protein
MVSLFLVLYKNAKLSSKVAAPFCIHTNSGGEIPVVPHSHQHLVLSVLWSLAILILHFSDIT